MYSFSASESGSGNWFLWENAFPNDRLSLYSLLMHFMLRFPFSCWWPVSYTMHQVIDYSIADREEESDSPNGSQLELSWGNREREKGKEEESRDKGKGQESEKRTRIKRKRETVQQQCVEVNFWKCYSAATDTVFSTVSSPWALVSLTVKITGKSDVDDDHLFPSWLWWCRSWRRFSFPTHDHQSRQLPLMSRTTDPAFQNERQEQNTRLKYMYFAFLSFSL